MNELTNYYLNGPINQYGDFFNCIINTIDATPKFFTLIDYFYSYNLNPGYIFTSCDIVSNDPADYNRKYGPGPLLLNFHRQTNGSFFIFQSLSNGQARFFTTRNSNNGELVISPAEVGQDYSAFQVFYNGNQVSELFAGKFYSLFVISNNGSLRKVSFELNDGARPNASQSELCLDSIPNPNGINNLQISLTDSFYVTPIVWNYRGASTSKELPFTSFPKAIISNLFSNLSNKCSDTLSMGLAVSEQLSYIYYLEVAWFANNMSNASGIIDGNSGNTTFFKGNTLYTLGNTTKTGCEKNLNLAPCVNPNSLCGDEKSLDNNGLGCIGKCRSKNDTCDLLPFGTLNCINKYEKDVIYYVDSFLGKAIILFIVIIFFAILIYIIFEIQNSKKIKKIKNDVV